MKCDVVNTAGKKIKSIELSDEIYACPLNEAVLHSVVKAYRANKRQGTHATKTRSLISGGGKKPLKQKGTGNARQGSTRSPLMEGGAVVHGPQPRSYNQKINKKIKKKALKVALSDKVRHQKVFILDDIAFDKYSTKAACELIDKLKLSGKKLCVVDSVTTDHLYKSIKNIEKASFRSPEVVNIEDILNHEFLVITEKAIESIKNRVGLEA